MNVQLQFSLQLAAIALVANAAFADIAADFLSVDNSAVPELSGYITQDLSITTDTDWLAGNLFLSLSSGDIYQSAYGNDLAPPSPAIVSFFPEAAFDTYVAGRIADAFSSGGAADLSGNAAATFGVDNLDINWFTTSTDDVGTFTIGRFSFSDDASGAFTLRLDAAESRPLMIEGAVTDGAMSITQAWVEQVTPPLVVEPVLRPPSTPIDYNYSYALDYLTNYLNGDLTYSLPSLWQTPRYFSPLDLGTGRRTLWYSEFTGRLNLYPNEYITLTETLGISLTPIIPEPGTMLLLGCAAACLLRRTRRAIG